MYIAPNSTVKLLKNVPLEPQQDNTIFFTSKTQQYNWFNAYLKTGMTFDKQYYQRHSKDFLKLEVLADDIFDCNYMMFRNTSFGNKWFYAFITNIEYVNNTVSMIQYEIDDMQTWFFDYQLGECFVEREHSETDEIGDNLIPENLPTGELQYASSEDFINVPTGGSMTQLCVIVAAPFDKSANDANGTVAGNLYSGIRYNIFRRYTDSNNVVHSLEDQLDSFFNNVRTQVRASEIVTMFYYLRDYAILPGSIDTPNSSFSITSHTITKDYSGFKNDYNDANEIAYTPRNNKLFTAPYNYLTVTDYNRNTTDYMYEFFNGSSCQFYLAGGLSCQPFIAVVPKKYMGNGEYQVDDGNLDYAFWYTDFPKIAWNSDGFIAYLAQTSAALLAGSAVDLAVMGATGIANLGVGAMNANPEIGGRLSKAAILNNENYSGMQGYSSNAGLNPTSVKGIMAGAAVAALRGKKVSGNNIGIPNWTIDSIRISAVHKKIRKEYAIRIDDYFNMFGYACNRVKIPNIGVRPRWNYVKTKGCVLQNSRMPADSARRIIGLYDKGITFWKSTATVGDYSADNSPVTP